MKQNKKQIKKILSNNVFKSDLEKKDNSSDLIDELTIKLYEERNADYIDFLESIITVNDELFSQTLNTIKKNPQAYSIMVNNEEKQVVNISKTLISKIKSKRDLDILDIAVKANFFDKERDDFYTPKSIDIIKKYGSHTLKELVKDKNLSKRRKNNANI